MSLFPLFVLLLLQISSLELISSLNYTKPDKYFINCGSKSSTNFSNGRAFVGDESDQSFELSHGQSKSVKDNNPSSNTPSLYHTARVYQQPSSYELEVGQNGTYIVRLHFFSFSSSSFNLSDAVFNVSASGFSLLSNFNVKNSISTNTTSTSTDLPVKEFLLKITQRKFSLYFVPSSESTFAFVNAIEVFPVPDRFIPESASLVTSSGSNGNYSGLLSLVLHTVHRINVGGNKITPENDTLWRTWIEDEAYVIDSKSAVNTKFSPDKLDRSSEEPNEYIAPDYVYQTAKFLTVANSSEQANFSEMGWGFGASENVTRHLVRLHFCDIISPAIDNFSFSLFIYDKFKRSIYPYMERNRLAAPFFLDFVVDSNGSSSINVSIDLRPQNSPNASAFLNGLEIFEMQNISGLIPPESRPKNKQGVGLIVGLVLSCVATVGILISGFLVFMRRKAKLGRNSGVFLYGGPNSHRKSSEGTANLSDLNLSLKISFAEIQEATSNFHDKLLIGEGGFGKVYLGTLGGIKVAVKRSKPGHGQGLAEFQTEILVLSQIRYRHLVWLIGYCNESDEMILVYEFMENGTLREHLYDSKGEPQGKLSWERRLEICIGAAKGLDYLHSDSTKGIFHRDVKSTNILLDENYDAKVADFGLSKTGIADPNNESMVLKGSFGYFDPEYIRSSQYTVKSDVYSFGVVILEVICARPAIFTLSQEEDNVSLAKWGMSWQRKGQLEKILDPSLVGDISPNSLRIVGKLAEKCLRESGFERPAMKEVVWDLSYALQLHKGATQGGTFEDTATNASLESALPDVRRAALPFEEYDSNTQLSGYSNAFNT